MSRPSDPRRKLVQRPQGRPFSPNPHAPAGVADLGRLLPGWHVVVVDRDGCLYLELLPENRVQRAHPHRWWCFALLVAMAGGILL